MTVLEAENVSRKAKSKQIYTGKVILNLFYC